MNAKPTSFEQELMNIQLDLLFYITSLMGNPTVDNQDVLQEVNRILLERRAEYDPGRAPLISWARSLAYYEVRSWRARNRRSRLLFSEEAMQRIADTVAAEAPAPVDCRLRYLDQCYRALPLPLRELVAAHHLKGISLESLAARSGKSVHAVAAALYRLRAILRQCVERKIRKEAAHA